jgi:hypothetical protein
MTDQDCCLSHHWLLHNMIKYTLTLNILYKVFLFSIYQNVLRLMKYHHKFHQFLEIKYEIAAVEEYFRPIFIAIQNVAS